MLDRRRRTDPIARMTDPPLDGMARVASAISGVCLVVLIVIFGWLVFGRYALNETPTWVEQVGLLLVVVIAFFSAAVGVRENTHLNVTALVAFLPPRGQRLARVASDLIMATFGGILTYQAIGLAEFGWNTRIPLIDLPEGVRSIPIAIAGVLICVFAGVRLLRRLSGASIDEDAEIDPDLADALASQDAADGDGRNT